MDITLKSSSSVFTPPNHEDEPPLIKSFLGAPDFLTFIKNFFSKGILSNIVLSKQIVKHFDTLTLVTLIISIALMIIPAISLFFAVAIPLKTTLIITLLVGSLSTCFISLSYIKRYYLLTRVQKEVKFLEQCSKKLQTAYDTLEQNNTYLKTNIENLEKKLLDFDLQNKVLATHLATLNVENQTYKTANLEYKDSNEKLKNHLLELKKINDENKENFEKIKLDFYEENEKLKNSNLSLHTSVENLQDIEAKLTHNLEQGQLQYEALKNFNEHTKLMATIIEGQKIELVNLQEQVVNLTKIEAQIKTTLDLHKLQNEEISSLLTTKKVELDKVTQKLIKVTNDLVNQTTPFALKTA